MAASKHLKLNLKFNLILSCVLIMLFLGTAFLTYRNQQEVAEKIALEQGRNVTGELMTIFNHMSDIVNPLKNTPQIEFYAVRKNVWLHCSARSQLLQFYRNC